MPICGLDNGGHFTESADIYNSTFYLNYADLGGAIWKSPGGSGILQNTIVADSQNLAGTAPSLNCDGNAPLVSYGRNIISDSSCLPNPGVTGDLFNTDPDLGPWMGAPVWGYLPNPNSPAIGYGQDCLNIDQRDYPRPLGNGCEVGSLEIGAVIYLPSVMR